MGTRHFGSYKQNKIRGTQHKGPVNLAGQDSTISVYSTVKSSQLSWAGQYNKCVQYDFVYEVYFRIHTVGINKKTLSLAKLMDFYAFLTKKKKKNLHNIFCGQTSECSVRRFI